MYELRKYRIKATKRDTGEVIEGTTKWDGLASLYAILTANGEYRYASCLDTIEKTHITEEQVES